MTESGDLSSSTGCSKLQGFWEVTEAVNEVGISRVRGIGADKGEAIPMEVVVV